MRDDRDMRIASEVALVSIALGFAWYFVQLGIGLATEFGYPRRGVLPSVLTTVSLAFSVASLVSWWFLARSTLNGAKLLFINVATYTASVIFGHVNRAILQAFHNYGAMQNVSIALNLALTAVTIAVFAILVSKNAGRARVFLSMFLATEIISCLLIVFNFFIRSIAMSHEMSNMVVVIPMRILVALASLISTAAWLLVHTESRPTAGCVEGVEEEEPAPKRIPLLWRIFIVAIPLLVFTKVTPPGKASFLLFFAPAGVPRLFVNSNSAYVLLPFGYAAYIAVTVAILWSRTRRPLLISVTAGLFLIILNAVGCATSLKGLHL